MRIGLPVPFSILKFRFSIQRLAVRPFLALAALAMLMAGCIGPIGEGPLRAVAMGPFLDRPARLTVVRLISDVDSGTLAAVVINFAGQNLRADSINMNFEPPITGTLQDILTGELERYKWDLFEIRGPDRKLLGYLLAHQNRLVGHYFESDGTLMLRGAIPKASGD